MADTGVHIGVDARELVGRPTGVGRYLAGILDVWAADPQFRHRVTLFSPAPLDHAISAEKFSVHVIPSSAGGTTWEQSRLPKAATAAQVNVFFAPGYTAPIRLTVPYVVAIHDLSFFEHPEWFSWREGIRRRWMTRAAAKRAFAIATLSEFSAGQLVKHLGVARERIHIAPPGAPPITQHTVTSREPVVLFVGSLFNRRHIPELVHGFAHAIERVPDARLILVGDNRTHPRVDPVAIARVLGIDHRVDLRDYVDDGALAKLYARARVFAFLSEYEGFAMTPMEALAAGSPSVLLDTPVAREVYASAATYVSTSAHAIGEAIADLLLNDDLRDERLRAGRAQISAYSWERTARQIRQLLEDAAHT